jgi:SAM-dependent methyltransferase
MSEVERVPYTACPLCNSDRISDLIRADASNYPHFDPRLPAEMLWRLCEDCSHCFTSGYFDDEGMAILYKEAHDTQVPTMQEFENHRVIAGRVVTAVSQVRGSMTGTWLEVGFGNGMLLTTAAEFGYKVLGIDIRDEPVEMMCEHGYQAEVSSVMARSDYGSWDVLSMADVLEHLPFPAAALDQVHKLLSPDGVVFLSMPNISSYSWIQLDRQQVNPYWAELEHFHNFGRARLSMLLEEHGFSPCWYGVSQRYRAGMELIARKQAVAG